MKRAQREKLVRVPSEETLAPFRAALLRDEMLAAARREPLVVPTLPKHPPRVLRRIENAAFVLAEREGWPRVREQFVAPTRRSR